MLRASASSCVIENYASVRFVNGGLLGKPRKIYYLLAFNSKHDAFKFWLYHNYYT